MTSASEQTSASKREPGFYVVKKKDKYTVAEWNRSTHDDEYSWFQTGSRLEVSDEYWDYIDDIRLINFHGERHIERPSPQDEPDWNKILGQPDTPTWSDIEKYHEEGKPLGQPDELSKAPEGPDHCGGISCPFEYSCVDGCMHPPSKRTLDESVIAQLRAEVERLNFAYEVQSEAFKIQAEEIKRLKELLEQFVYYGMIHSVTGVCPAGMMTHGELINAARKHGKA